MGTRNSRQPLAVANNATPQLENGHGNIDAIEANPNLELGWKDHEPAFPFGTIQLASFRHHIPTTKAEEARRPRHRREYSAKLRSIPCGQELRLRF